MCLMQLYNIPMYGADRNAEGSSRRRLTDALHDTAAPIAGLIPPQPAVDAALVKAVVARQASQAFSAWDHWDNWDD